MKKKVLITKSIEDAGELQHYAIQNKIELVYHSFLSFEQIQISEISLLKIDIEGQEYDVVPNLEKSILDITNSISLETHIMYGGDDYSLVNYLVENGFNHKTITERDSHKEHFFWK